MGVFYKGLDMRAVFAAAETFDKRYGWVYMIICIKCIKWSATQENFFQKARYFQIYPEA